MGCTIPLAYFPVFINSVKATLEFWSTVDTYCGRLAMNALPRIEYTAFCEIAAAPRIDYTWRMGCWFCSHHNLRTAASSLISPSLLIVAGQPPDHFGLDAWNWTHDLACGVSYTIFSLGVRSNNIWSRSICALMSFGTIFLQYNLDIVAFASNPRDIHFLSVWLSLGMR